MVTHTRAASADLLSRRLCVSRPDGIDTAGKDSLLIVDSSLFMVCLDHYSPHTLSELSRNILHGTSEVESGIQCTCVCGLPCSALLAVPTPTTHGLCACVGRLSTAGTCLNRWYDKSLQASQPECRAAGKQQCALSSSLLPCVVPQIIVCENGSAGVNFEHSNLDGHTVLRFASDVFTDTILYEGGAVFEGVNVP